MGRFTGGGSFGASAPLDVKSSTRAISAWTMKLRRDATKDILPCKTGKYAAAALTRYHRVTDEEHDEDEYLPGSSYFAELVS
jgi:hypothetical protein